MDIAPSALEGSRDLSKLRYSEKIMPTMEITARMQKTITVLMLVVVLVLHVPSVGKAGSQSMIRGECLWEDCGNRVGAKRKLGGEPNVVRDARSVFHEQRWAEG